MLQLSELLELWYFSLIFSIRFDICIVLIKQGSQGFRTEDTDAGKLNCGALADRK